MKQVNLGSQGLRVPAIGLGCMGMSEKWGWSGAIGVYPPRPLL